MGHTAGKYDVLLSFFYSVLKDASEDGLAMYKELLKELKADEEEVRKAKVEDEGMKRIIKDIGYSRKIRKAIEADEPPEHVKGYVSTFLSEAAAKAKAFFVEQKPEPKSFSIKDVFDNSVMITVSRALFPKDRRIIESEEDVFVLELSCYYRKEKKRLELVMSVRFKVEEKEVPDIDSSNLVIFDKLLEALDLVEGFEKSVRFNATISEGKTFCDNTCEVCWTKTLEM